MIINADITVIGGGASGLMCALRASQNNKNRKIIILEKEDRTGKKILVSGNGRCNLTNVHAKRGSYNGGNTDIIDILYENYPPQKIISYFNSLGLVTYEDSEGRVYPKSNLSSSVLNILRSYLRINGVREYTGINITDIKKAGEHFEIITDNSRITTKKLVIATGGTFDYKHVKNSNTKNVLEMLGYSYKDIRPALSGVNAPDLPLDFLHGIRVKGRVSLYVENIKVKEDSGEIQFTKNGLSGICVFNLSRHIENDKKCFIKISLLPELSDSEIENYLITSKDNLCEKNLDDLFTGMFHKNIGMTLLKECNINIHKSGKDLTGDELKKLVHIINSWDIKVKSKKDFKNAQVSAGGIGTDEINNKTFETVKHKNLYILGEALDIDGECGGFNLQFAFASGMCAGDNI